MHVEGLELLSSPALQIETLVCAAGSLVQSLAQREVACSGSVCVYV